MRNLRKALLSLGIEKYLEEQEKEARSLFIRGLIENGKRINESIILVKEFLKNTIDK